MRKKPYRRRQRKLRLEGLEGRRLLAQMAFAAPSTQTVDVNDTFTVTTNYSTVPAEQTTGVSLRLHYNPNLVSFDVADIIVPAAPAPQTQGNPFIADDTGDTDSDPTTTKFVQVDFVDIGGMFPTEASPLFDAMFTAIAEGTANFNYSFNNATGETSSTPATVTINESTELAGQVAMASPATQTVNVNDTFTVTTNYSTIPAMQTTGVSLRLHYNPTLVSFDVGDITVPATPAPQTQGTPFINDDTNDSDNDPTTTQFVQVDFVDIGGMFPTEASPLFDAMFTAIAEGTANFNYSFNNATGTTSSTSATVTINESTELAGQVAMASPATQTVNVNDTFTVTTNYSTIPAMQTTGVSLRLHYNPTLVSFDVGDITVPPAPAPQTQGTPFINDDTNDTDNDPTTTQFVQVDFVDIGGMFPTEASPLFDAMFTAIAEGTANFNYSFNNATGTTSSTPATVTINPEAPTVSVSVDPASVAEDGTANLVYTFTRDSGSGPVTVNYTTGGTATAGTDYVGTDSSVTIPDTGTATVTVDPTPDTLIEGDETVVLTITADSAYNIGTASATGTITDAVVTPPTVSVSVSPTSVAEDGTANLVYTFTRDSGSGPVTVNYTTGGTATAGTDYVGTDSSVTIPDTGTATVTVDPTPDTLIEGDETVVLTITADSAYNIGTASATGTITDAVVTPPTVSVSVSPTSVAEDGTANLVYTFTRDSGSGPVTVNYTTGGTATAGTDYVGTDSSVTIPDTGTATVTVDPTPDTLIEGDETVVLTITADSAYNIGTASATGTITDAVVTPPTVSVSVSPTSVAEDGTANLVYTFTRDSGSGPVTVNYTTGGTATAGIDYVGTDSSVTIPDSGTATVTVDPTPDTLTEGDETVVLTIAANSSYNISTGSATGTILDVPPPTPVVSFTSAGQSAVEDDATLTVTAQLMNAPSNGSTITVPFTVTGTADAGSDFTVSPSGLLTFSGGATQATISINVIEDAIDEANETVVITLGTPTGANLGTTTVHTATIIDDDGATGNRIIIPEIVARPYFIPGDGRPTAVLFRAEVDTTLTVSRIGATSVQPAVSLLDEGLQSLGGLNDTGRFTADLMAGELYAVIFLARNEDAIFTIDSSAGFDSLSTSGTNTLNSTDVNADGESTALDALLVINQINRQSLAEGEDVDAAAGEARFYDVNGDGNVTAADALRVINVMAEQPDTENEFATVAVPSGQRSTEDLSAGESLLTLDQEFKVVDAGVKDSNIPAELLDRLEPRSEASEDPTDQLLASDSFLDELMLS